jgi:hypothetical protein
MLALGAAGCSVRPSSPPPPTLSTLAVERPNGANRTYDLRHQPDVGESSVPAGLTAVWGVLPGVFERLEIEVSRVDAANGIMGTEGYRARRVAGERMSLWLDCGRGPVQAVADEYQVTLLLMVQILAAAEGTVVRTTVDAYARGRDSSGSSVHCISSGRLERRIPEMVMELLES